jgi:group I intron endonuclease
MINCGVYKIINLVNHFTYVGSSVNLRRREKSHFKCLKLNKHVNKHLQNSYNKYGENSFAFEILECVIDVAKLIEREQYYIDVLNPEYNICKIAGSTSGVQRPDLALYNKLNPKIGESNPFYGKKHNSETLQILSECQLGSKSHCYGKKHSDTVKQRTKQARLHIFKPVICIETGKIYESVSEAERQTSIFRCSIIKVCKHTQHTAGGLHWEYYNA